MELDTEKVDDLELGDVQSPEDKAVVDPDEPEKTYEAFDPKRMMLQADDEDEAEAEAEDEAEDEALEVLEPTGPLNPNAPVEEGTVFDPAQVLSPDDEWIPNDHRARERHEWQAKVEVKLTEGLRHDDDGETIRLRESYHRTITVVTEDLSTGGFAFVHKGFIHPGTVVKVKFTMLPNQPVYLGVVRHCNSIGGMRHRVGVQFQAAPGKR